jgi:hypothetical protein
MNEVTRHTRRTSMFAVYLGNQTIGYGMAYFAAIRCDSGKRVAANNGATFFYWFAGMNEDAQSDEQQLTSGSQS